MRRIVLLAVVGLGLGLCSRASADLAPPLPQTKEAVGIKIEVDEKAKGPRMIIPNGVFSSPRGRPVPNPKSTPNKGEPKTSLEQDNGDELALEDSSQGSAQPRHHVLIAGVAVALSLAFGGLWFVRKNGRGSGRSLTLLIAAGATLTIGAFVYANVPPPKTFDKPPAFGKNVEAFPVALENKAKVEFVFGQEPVRLILDKESFEKLKKGELKEVK